MNVYKITNITNFLGKRDADYNTTLDIKYVDGMIKKTLKLKPNETVFLSINSLPLSVHRLRIKRLVNVGEVANRELVREMIQAKPKPEPPAPKLKKEKPVKLIKEVDVQEEKDKKEKVTTPKGKKTTAKTETETAE